MTSVKGLYALQNGFLGAQRSLLFYGEFSEAAVEIPVTCYLVRTSDGTILFDTGVSPRAVPGLMRSDSLALFTDADLLVHRLDAIVRVRCFHDRELAAQICRDALDVLSGSGQ